MIITLDKNTQKIEQEAAISKIVKVLRKKNINRSDLVPNIFSFWMKKHQNVSMTL